MTGTPPSVLAVTSELPWPLNTGGHIRTFYMLRALAARFRVRLVTAVTSARPADCSALEAAGVSVRSVVRADSTRVRESVRALAAAVCGTPYVMYARHGRSAVMRALEEEVARESPSVFYLDHLDSWQFRRLASMPAVIDLHNIYSMLVERTAGERPTAVMRAYLKREARLLADVERRVAEHADCVFAVSGKEADSYRSLGAQNVHVVPNGVDCAVYDRLPVGRAGGSPTILYLGALSWLPNVAAAQFLARTVLPRVRALVPGARLHVIGRDPLPEALALADQEGVTVLANVPDVRPHLADASVLAVPLESGGGTRLKILEAFAAGLPVVSTPVGCEGIDAQHGTHLLIAERADFADATASVLAHRADACARAARARQLAQSVYDWDVVGQIAVKAIEELASRPRP